LDKLLPQGTQGRHQVHNNAKINDIKKAAPFGEQLFINQINQELESN